MTFQPQPFSSLVSLTLAQGDDKAFTIALNPRRNVTGWIVEFHAISRTALIAFPPQTIPLWESCYTWWLPFYQIQVMPGVQPILPTTGSVYSIFKDNAARGGVVLSDATHGVFTVSLASADTSANPPDQYLWRLARVDSGQRTILVSGDMAVLGVP